MSEETVCSCGESRAHVIAERTTLDGVRLSVWSDGAVTQRMGLALAGLGMPKSGYTKARRKRVVALLQDDFGLFDAREIPGLIKRGEYLARYTYASEAARRADILRRRGS